MVKHYPELIGIVLLLVFAATMFYQGTMIMRGQRGYRHCEREDKKMLDMRKRVEDLMREK
jgi:hypothetical protein